MGKKGERTSDRWVSCPVCGHTWYTKGNGKILRCPHCYELRTGRKMGQSRDFLHKIAPANNAAVADTIRSLPPKVEPQQTVLPSTESKPKLFDWLLNLKIL